MNNMRILLILGVSLIGFLISVQYKRLQPLQQGPNPELSALLAEKPIKHLGIIMDGNRRWAKKKGLQAWIGHKEGVNPVKETINFCLEHQIQHLTLYVFSLENFKRPAEELNYLFDVLAQEVASKEFTELMEKGIHVSFIGARNLFPPQLVPIILDMEQKTATNTKLHLNLLFCYGGHQEILAAAQQLCQQVKEGTGKVPATFDDFKQALWSHNLPPLDLIIRTAGDQRLSNYLPIQSAYSELYFVTCYWPDLTRKELDDAGLFFSKSKRNFGG